MSRWPLLSVLTLFLFPTFIYGDSPAPASASVSTYIRRSLRANATTTARGNTTTTTRHHDTDCDMLPGDSTEDDPDEEEVAPVHNVTHIERVPRPASKNFGSWYTADNDQGQSPWNLRDLGNNRFSMTIKPNEQAVRLSSKQTYTGGLFMFNVKSAAVMPGIITAVYFASGSGRTGDNSLGHQDEIDLEWKGNDQYRVQSNVFLQGHENLQLLDLGRDSSQSERLYGIQWDTHKVDFLLDGKTVRSVYLARPLAPMKLHMAVWTTDGGWPGLIQWGGKTEWSRNSGQPIEAVFEIKSLPH